MKSLKKIFAVVGIGIILTTSNCLAVSLKDTICNENICYKTYDVMEDEQSTFLEMLQKEIEIDDSKYKYIDYTTSGGNTVDTIEINASKTILSNTNDISNIIEQLGESLEYNENQYIGKYNLNKENIEIKTKYNGYKEELIEEHIQYSNLLRNDLDSIPKQTNKNGLILDLLKVEWKVEDTKKIGEYDVPDRYTAECYYATKQRVDYPNTYTVTAQYKGTASKIEINLIRYIVKYEKQALEKQTNNIIPVFSGIVVICLIIGLLFTGNVVVYSYKDGKYKRVGKTRVFNRVINLSKFSYFEKSNKYKIVLSKSLTKKLEGKLITVKKNNNSLKLLVNTNGTDQFGFETRI